MHDSALNSSVINAKNPSWLPRSSFFLFHNVSIPFNQSKYLFGCWNDQTFVVKLYERIKIYLITSHWKYTFIS